MSTHVTSDELLHKVKTKFNAPSTLRLQYKDEDEEMVIMIDDDDFNMARQICRMRTNSSNPERMEIWYMPKDGDIILNEVRKTA
ncbi:hypothetical protein INT45_008743 [Circinella minor]|uniref:PB1 domain-containing protein n=1 Tax=Circinella minor TaxID=1195481 RepID=A0A8H7S0B9_9FUNG|nr:hypothetical protein INT45_008743 [Circinella minor]